MVDFGEPDEIIPTDHRNPVISKTNHIKQRPEFNLIPPYLAGIILHENNIKVENG